MFSAFLKNLAVNSKTSFSLSKNTTILAQL